MFLVIDDLGFVFSKPIITVLIQSMRDITAALLEIARINISSYIFCVANFEGSKCSDAFRSRF